MGFFFKKSNTTTQASQEECSYKKGDIDFESVPPLPTEHTMRYAREGRVWKQVKPGTEGRAVILCAGDLRLDEDCNDSAN